METRIVAVDPRAFSAEGVRPVLEAIRQGEIAVVPTETFYGLGVDAFSARAVRSVYGLKERDRGKPLPVVVSDLGAAERLASEVPAVFRKIAAEFWPGPLTLVVKAKPVFPAEMLGPGGTVAVRVPGSPWLRGLLAAAGVPLTATSANLSGDAEVSDPADIVRLFGGRVAVIVDGGRTPGGRPSTVVDLTASPPRVLRDGAVPAARLSPFLAS